MNKTVTHWRGMTLPSAGCVAYMFFFFFFFFYLKNKNLKRKIYLKKKQGLGNPNLKLRMKVRGGNASEDAGPLARGTDASKPGSLIKVISQVY
jgi:hypothetical protein